VICASVVHRLTWSRDGEPAISVKFDQTLKFNYEIKRTSNWKALGTCFVPPITSYPGINHGTRKSYRNRTTFCKLVCRLNKPARQINMIIIIQVHIYKRASSRHQFKLKQCSSSEHFYDRRSLGNRERRLQWRPCAYLETQTVNLSHGCSLWEKTN
jgi:hypothetical protein